MPGSRDRLATLLTVVLAASSLAVVGGYLYLQHVLGGTLEQALGERLGTDARVGIAYVGLLPAGLHLSSLTVRNPEDYRDRDFLELDSLAFRIGQYDPDARRLTSPRMDIEGLKVWIEYQGGTSNADDIKRNLSRYDRRHGRSRADKTKLVIRELHIRDIRAQLRRGSDSTDTALSDIVLRNVGRDRNGVTLGELADIVTRTILRRVVRQEFKRELDQQADEEGRELREKLDRKLEELLD